MTVSEMIIDRAKTNGLDHYFGLPGSGALMDIMDAGRKTGVQFVSVAHESSAAIAAAYYGYMRGAAGLALAIKGPGAGNLAGGAVMSFFERKPAICLCESVSTPSALAQKCDHRGLYQSVVKSYFRLTKDSASQDMREAFALAADGHPGPVLVDLPPEIAGESCRIDDKAKRGAGEPGIASPSQEQPDTTTLTAARTFAGTLERPVIIAGADVCRDGGASALKELADSLKAAVLVTMEARGLVAEDDPRFAGVYTGVPSPAVLGNQILSKSDGALLIGVDSIMTETPWSHTLPTCELVSRSDYDTMSDRPRIRVNGNLRTAIKGVLPRESREGYPLDLIAEIRQAVARRFVRPPNAKLAAQDIIETTRDLLPRDGMLFSETGVFVLMLEQLWPVYKSDTFFGTTAGRTMGLTIPAVLGAKLAQPDIPMVGIGADGSTLMRLGELEVFSRMDISVPLVIVNDGCLGTIKARQKGRGLPPYALELQPVDFAAIARSCGLNGVVVDTPEQFRTEITHALKAERTTVIDARVDTQAYQDSFGPTLGV